MPTVPMSSTALPTPAALAALAKSTQDDLRRYYARSAQAGKPPHEALAEALAGTMRALRAYATRTAKRPGSEDAAAAIEEMLKVVLGPIDPARATFDGVMRLLDRLVAAGAAQVSSPVPSEPPRPRVRQFSPYLERLTAMGMNFPAKDKSTPQPIDGLIFALELMQELERTRKPDLLKAGDVLRLGALEMLDNLFTQQIEELEAAKADGDVEEAMARVREFFLKFDELQREHAGEDNSRKAQDRARNTRKRGTASKKQS